MHGFDADEYLGYHMLSLRIRELQSFILNYATQGTIFAELHQEVKILLILECRMQLYDLRNVFEFVEDVALVEDRVHEVGTTCLVVLHDDLNCE